MPSLYEVPLTALSGVGQKRAELFAKLNIRTVGDLIRFYPRSYENWAELTPIVDLTHGEKCVIRARVMGAVSVVRLSGNRLMAKVPVADDTGYLTLVFFNNKYISSMLKYGEEYLFMGKAAHDGYGFQMVSPEFSPVDKSGAIMPVYNLTAGLTNRVVVHAVKEALSMLPETIRDPLPYQILRQYDLCTLSYALQHIHFPTDQSALERARTRLVFEELLVLNLGMRMMRTRARERTSVRMTEDYTGAFIERLPFTLTSAQRRAVADCVADMKDHSYPMNRLIQGDVGSGKTAVCAALCYHCVKNGYQAAFMAPTEILARQHYDTFSKMFDETGISIELLTGALSSAEKKRVRARIETGESDIVIGTHALLSESTVFDRLGLALTDEQHRFGVEQRSRLSDKGEHPHVLVLSATPIPRTLGLIIYGDLDVTVIDEMPPGRTEVKTLLIDSEKRHRAMGFIRDQIIEGRQCYIVTPLVDESENELSNVNDYAAELMLGEFRNIPVGILHGKMKPRDKEEVMSLFSNNEISVLVSTTVVEVGVDIKNATVMMIENAERFGLSQLHQLRGRVGRGEHQSYCILVSDNQGDATRRRLSTMCRTNNGFEIADEDLRLRGPGDFFGSRQHGLPKLSIADFSDIETLERSQQAAATLLQLSPDLSVDSLRGLRAEIRQLFLSAGETLN